MISISGKKWLFQKPDERYILLARQKYSISDILARVLRARNIALDDIPFFLNAKIRDLLPDPSLLLDMKIAVQRTFKAIQNHEKITIYGDYDVDGATSVSLLFRYFDLLGISTEYYIPDRLSEGYGVNKEAIEKIAYGGTKLVFMVDCGTTSVTEVDRARELGMDVIIFDHHVLGGELPQATAVVNAYRLDQPFVPYVKDLCSAGITFLFLVELQRYLYEKGRIKEKNRPNLINFCDFVALGTVCDVMPLQGLNRAFVKRGLEFIQKRRNFGLRALIDVSKSYDRISSYHLGFVLGPRINAGGRVGTSLLGTQLLTTQDELKAQEIAQTLHDLNTERQFLEKKTLEEAIQQIEKQSLLNFPVILVGADSWHPGVIGIVASRLKDLYNRPCFVASFHQNYAKGSARSVEGLDLGNLIHQAVRQHILESGGGHAMAGGFTVSQERFKDFYDFLNDCTSEFMISYYPILKIDAELSINGATLDLVSELEALEPFGTGNPKPRFCFHHVYSVFNREVGASHFQCQLSDEQGNIIKAIAFRSKGTKIGQALEDKKIMSVVGTLNKNEWMNKESVQFIIEDIMTTY